MSEYESAIDEFCSYVESECREILVPVLRRAELRQRLRSEYGHSEDRAD